MTLMLHEQKLTYPEKIKEILEDTIEAGKIISECLPDVMKENTLELKEVQVVIRHRYFNMCVLMTTLPGTIHHRLESCNPGTVTV